MWRYLRIAAIVAIAASILLSRSRRTTVGESPANELPLTPTLAEFIKVLHSAESDDAPVYLRALDQLRGDREAVLRAADAFLRAGGAGDAGLRHSIVMAIAAMRDPATLDLLALVALNPQPLPPKEGSHEWLRASHHAEDVVQGAMVSLEAIEGLEALAQDDHTPALDVLVRAAGAPSNPVRAAALTALRSSPEWAEHFRRAEAALSPEMRHLAQVRRVQPWEVQQIRDPRVHLAGREIGHPAAPSLESKESPSRASVSNAPLVSGGK